MDEHAYFRAIEERFIELRGAPLLLSPGDYQIARRWWRERVPLEVVRGALEEVFARRAERDAGSPVQSLRYCASAVDAAWRSARELQEAGRRQRARPIDPEVRLARLAESIPAEHPSAESLRERIRALTGEPEAIEARLAELDARMVADAEAALTETERKALDERLERSLEALGRRLTRAEADDSRRRLFERALRRKQGLPLLTLFGDSD